MFLFLKGCRQNNLKNISLKIPKHQLTVITGVSGSGKSSLAFDTLFAEGQRRYLEYLSPEARTWIKQMPRPNVDLIEGLSPTLAIRQDPGALYVRGTVATYTDIYDFLCLLYAHLGEQHSPATGKRLIRYSRQEMIDLLLHDYPTGTRLQLIAPISLQNESLMEAVKRLQKMGFVRFKIDDQEWLSEDLAASSFLQGTKLDVIVDRLEIKEGIRERLSSSLETTLDLSRGVLKLQEGRSSPFRYLTEVYVCPESGLSFAPLEPPDFNFNSPRGACPLCQGRGEQETILSDLVLTESAPLIEQVFIFLDMFFKRSALLHAVWAAFADKKQIPETAFISTIPPSLLEEILRGSSEEFDIPSYLEGENKWIRTNWKGLIPLLEGEIKDKKGKEALIEQPFIQKQICPACQGGRLKPESLACLIKNKNIQEICSLTVSQARQEIGSWNFSSQEMSIANEILPHIQNRLLFLEQVGVGYLELNRSGKTLSGGETQRIQLASQIGAKLSGILYILDEPSLGLHRQDIAHLQQVFEELKQLGNTVVLVEHEASLIRQADHLIELGPGAGLHGGQLIFEGSYPELIEASETPTAKWLTGKAKLSSPARRKKPSRWLSIKEATVHNLKNLSIQLPLERLVGFCGVSGSGKSTLAIDVIGNEMEKYLRSSKTSLLSGQESLKRLIISERQTHRFSARSIPATYLDLMTPLRQLFAETKLAKARGYTAARFSLNKKGGRCEACQGLGQIRVNMQWMPDLFTPCEVCKGERYNYETLQITWENFNIADVLNLPVEKAFDLFRHIPSLAPKLELMKELGLEYLTLGQPFHILSGGEIQRLQLIADLGTKQLENTLYILDEPSAGLHFQDIAKLVKILHRLVDQGHSVIVVEHHLDLLSQMDWLVELGPGGGAAGGQILFEGPSKDIPLSTPTGRLLHQ